MKHVSFKNALFLENDFAYGYADVLGDLKTELENAGVICNFVGRAHLSLDEIKKHLAICEAIIFGSTFMYHDQIEPIGELLKNIPAKIILVWNCSGSNLPYPFEQIWDEKEMMQFDHHSVFEIKDYDFTEDGWVELVDLSKYRTKIEEEQRQKNALNSSRSLTGYKVKIKTIQPNGTEFSVLKEGDIVDEVIVEEDKHPGRGVWVMGKTEPVKLLNDSNYDEWEYHEPDPAALAHEICQMTGKGDKISSFVVEAIASYIPTDTPGDNGYGWRWVTDLCDEIGLPRRHYRSLIFARIVDFTKRRLQTVENG